MKSVTTNHFWECYHALPDSVQKQAEKAYSLFIQDHKHPSLRFKKVLNEPKVYSVRITQSYRALGVRDTDCVIWFWIGSHDDYELLLKKMS